MDFSCRTVDRKTVDLIKLFVLNQKALDTLIETFAKQAVIFKKNAPNEEEKIRLKALFLSDDFLNQFVPNFREKFTDEEILKLVEVYQSSEMKKLLDNGKDLLDPLYSSMLKEAISLEQEVIK